ncbi:RNA polymerase sigma factor [Thiobacillus sp.]|uniref:RNA polymerase sigma factor n=1 Tax=Thiobacillus sp. TaxID=924 RepID=UPI0025E40475|nr:RNA polymerase sigma factor [Thiobacillus sp.]
MNKTLSCMGRFCHDQNTSATAMVGTPEIEDSRQRNAMTTEHPIMAHVPQLRRYARALAKHEVEADDLVQDTLERALRKFSLWQQGTNLRAWLFSVMHNLYVNQVRSKQEMAPLDDDMDIPVGGRQEEGLRIRDLSTSLLALPLEQREVLLLVGLENFSYEEVAQTLGIPLGTVMSRLSRGRERLRRLLDGSAKPNLSVVI